MKQSGSGISWFSDGQARGREEQDRAVEKYWDKLPKDPVDSPALETFQAQPKKAMAGGKQCWQQCYYG